MAMQFAEHDRQWEKACHRACAPVEAQHDSSVELFWQPHSCQKSFQIPLLLRADFWEGDATKHFSVKKGLLGEKGEAIQ